MSLHLVIIDAMNLIRRVHSAQPDPDDIHRTINTTTQTLSKIIQETQPTHMVAVFDYDSEDKGWRGELFPAYKEKRKPMPTVLKQHLDDIQQSWWEIGLDSLLSDGDEADDLIATLAIKVASRQEQVTIISTDKGYCQLLSPTLRIRDYFQHRWLDASFIEQQFGVRPEQLTDFWGLAGISSSQISGIPGIGPKAAKDILTCCETLDEALQCDTLAEKHKKKLTEYAALARTCKKIATLKTDITLGFNLQDIRFSPPKQEKYQTE